MKRLENLASKEDRVMRTSKEVTRFLFTVTKS